jgi:transcriptional regulator with GAF, ATPase, and Fis domain
LAEIPSAIEVLEDAVIVGDHGTPSGKPAQHPKFREIIGQSRSVREVFKIVEKVADSECTVIIHGETGTGKGLVARAIHHHSERRSKPFIQINCGAIPENLLESELFGHVKGAFTGATSAKPGRFELANGGTIFLDEIGDMSPDLQVKILRVLEEREFERVGGCQTVKVDVRVIAATHRNLDEEVQKGRFREDLYYRLNVIPIHLSPLRERKCDLPLLIDHFLEKLNEKNHRQVGCISTEAMEFLMRHSWPGNIRELKNVIERMVVLKGEGSVLPADLPEKIRQQPRAGEQRAPEIEITEEGICLNTAVSEFEKALITQSLQKANGVKKKAARLLQLKRTTLVEKIKRYDLQQYFQG